MAKIISFLEQKAKILKDTTSISQKEAGELVWLYCPKCQSLEYSEIKSTKTRLHGCKTKMIEQKVSIDITAEYTICKMNLLRIDKFHKSFLNSQSKKLTKEEIDDFELMIEFEKRDEFQMIYRLQKITKKKALAIYEYTPENFELLPIADKTDIGVLISDFRFKPKARFKKMGYALEDTDPNGDDLFKK